eukprot:gnl/TRDRNA2_/TRDRNA2_192040_c0_seq1.p1 gnl/TRDRNA2_/TRDRNA2_192040_c0~~gnl/TRDRNA2_/TRDRNA2_192040_c0_seq1.p1  ORF type:complete len:207 (-),score=40.61 gnl/TRDRNA2_/TRDRNA2_192040_c0_seq1:29-649(-)
MSASCCFGGCAAAGLCGLGLSRWVCTDPEPPKPSGPAAPEAPPVPSPYEVAVAPADPPVRPKAVPAKKGPEPSRALYDACWNGDFEGAFKALENGADPKVGYGPRRNTALHVAARTGNPKCLGMILKRGGSDQPFVAPDLECKNAAGETPLFAAVVEGNAPATEALVDAKADVNARDSEGQSVLAVAKSRGREGFVEFLLKEGALE